jgi:hypothetical protein
MKVPWNKKNPPDLIDLVRSWTERGRRWTGEMDQVLHFIDYIDREPKVAERWRAVARELISRLEQFAQPKGESPHA